jgi:hypothetical protein
VPTSKKCLATITLHRHPELAKILEAKVRADLTERILREAGFEDQVAATIAAIKPPEAAKLVDGIEQLFEREPDREWRNHLVEVVAAILKNKK